MRNMSFFLTTQQFIDGTKDVTRRLGWANLKPDEHFMGIEKGQGLKKGEHVRRLGECICYYNGPEPLINIVRYPSRWPSRRGETTREGFPHLSATEFVEMFCKKMKCTPKTIVNRIEFARVIA
jgi:hypothetical protein